MRLTSFMPSKQTDIRFTPELLQALPCGLHQVPIREAMRHLPELYDLYPSVPLTRHEMDHYLIDVKIHMLMKGMYPCIPNWHCDHVPRVGGKLRYGAPVSPAPMFLWISEGPHTEFLAGQGDLNPPPKDHGELDERIRFADPETKLMPEQTWCAFWQDTPHRGTPATENGWRVFARLVHRSVIEQSGARQQVNPIRRHAQVYLPHDFHW